MGAWRNVSWDPAVAAGLSRKRRTRKGAATDGGVPRILVTEGTEELLNRGTEEEEEGRSDGGLGGLRIRTGGVAVAFLVAEEKPRSRRHRNREGDNLTLN